MLEDFFYFQGNHMKMKIGYARVSTFEQNLDLQVDALKKEGCDKIYIDKISGSVSERKELLKALEHLREGDTLVVWRLDRLGRSLKHLIRLLDDFEGQGVVFKSIMENLDTSSASGRLIFHIFGALTEFERNLIKERTTAGLASARARGRLGGRNKKLNREKREHTVKLYQEKKYTVKEICDLMGISKPTLYAYIRENKC